MWRHHNKNCTWFMVLPASFPATKRGFNSYLKALGLAPGSDNARTFAISLAQFISIDRRSIDEKIAEVGALCEQMHENYLNATTDLNREYYEGRWNYFSKKFVELVREKHSS